MPKPIKVPKTPKSGAGLERNQVPLSAEIIRRFRPKSVPVSSDFCSYARHFRGSTSDGEIKLVAHALAGDPKNASRSWD
jgi:hypothetical protein